MVNALLFVIVGIMYGRSGIDSMTKQSIHGLGLIGTANQAFYPIRSGNASLLLLQRQNSHGAHSLALV